MRVKKFVYGKTFRLKRGTGALSEGVSGGASSFHNGWSQRACKLLILRGTDPLIQRFHK